METEEEEDVTTSTRKLYHAYLLRKLQEADAKMPDVYMQIIGKKLKAIRTMFLNNFVKVYNHPNCSLTYRRNKIKEIVEIHLHQILTLEQNINGEWIDVKYQNHIQHIISTLQLVLVDLENYKILFESGQYEKCIPSDSFKKIVSMYTKTCMECFIM